MQQERQLLGCSWYGLSVHYLDISMTYGTTTILTVATKGSEAMARFMIRDTSDDIMLRVTPEIMQLLSEITQKPLEIAKGHHRLNTELSPEAIRGFDKTVEIVDGYWLSHTK